MCVVVVLPQCLSFINAEGLDDGIDQSINERWRRRWLRPFSFFFSFLTVNYKINKNSIEEWSAVSAVKAPLGAPNNDQPRSGWLSEWVGGWVEGDETVLVGARSYVSFRHDYQPSHSTRVLDSFSSRFNSRHNSAANRTNKRPAIRKTGVREQQKEQQEKKRTAVRRTWSGASERERANGSCCTLNVNVCCSCCCCCCCTARRRTSAAKWRQSRLSCSSQSSGAVPYGRSFPKWRRRCLSLKFLSSLFSIPFPLLAFIYFTVCAPYVCHSFIVCCCCSLAERTTIRNQRGKTVSGAFRSVRFLLNNFNKLLDANWQGEIISHWSIDCGRQPPNKPPKNKDNQRGKAGHGHGHGRDFIIDVNVGVFVWRLPFESSQII